MGSRRRISYKWRLFMPITLTLWAMLISMAWWQADREGDFRLDLIDTQLTYVNERVAYYINDNRPDALNDFMNFVEHFYRANDLFRRIHITIYDRNWDVVAAVGTPIALDKEEQEEVTREILDKRSRIAEFGDQKLFYRGGKARNGQTIISALSEDTRLHNFLEGDRKKVWVIFFAVAVALTIMLYMSAKYLSRNVSMLHEFARRSAQDPSFEPGTDFPHDKLGDVARQILALFRERRKAVERLEREHSIAMHAIEEKAAQKRQLTNNINHELKTPIGVIKGYLDTLVENPDLDEEIRDHFIAKAREHADRLACLIADISAITRLDEGANLISTERLNYHDLVYSFANDIQESGVIGHMEFFYDIPMDIFVKGNANILTAMLMNLAKNSANYSSGTSCTLEYNGTDGQFHSFSFYDDGVGVPESSLPHIFDRFYRVSTGRTRKSGGTGLGLSIVYNSVTAMGGTIEALNRPNAGFEIRFTLPAFS